MGHGLGLLGVPVDDVLMQEALQRIEGMIAEGGTHQVATANADYLVHAIKDVEYRRILCMCDLVVADGMPLVWASRFFGIPLRERVTGADLVPNLVRLSGLKGYKIFLLGASPEIAEAAQNRMKSLSPDVRLVGSLSPPIRPLEEFDNDSILAAIEEAQPDILLVAFGSPKQEKWISRNRHRLKVPVTMGIGGTLDFMAGSVKRAPVWMQRSGLEWLFRFAVDPKRLGPRYFNDALCLGRYLVRQLASQTFKSRPKELKVNHDSFGCVNVVSVSGALAGSGLAALEETLSQVVRSGQPIVLDLAATSHVGADGLWTLAELLRNAHQHGCEVCLSGLSRSLESQLRAAHFQGLFRSAPTLMEAIRGVSPARLQINLELGESWAVCRISGEVPPGARRTLEDICGSVRHANSRFELDLSGMTDFDPANLAASTRGIEENTVLGETSAMNTLSIQHSPRAVAFGKAN